MIINTSYFLYPPLKIPNAIVQPSIQINSPNNIGELESAIESVEYQFLINALGREQYVELSEQFETDGTWKPDALQKWKDLVDGKEDWQGMRYTIGQTKKSLIANYVYYEFLLNDQVHYSTTGLQRPKAENSSNVDPVSQLTRVWNQFVFMYQGYYDTCVCNNDMYVDNSLYKYMAAYPDLYSVASFKIYQLQNVWGI